MKMPKESLNQQKAIKYGMGPVAILAGPGSGKTFTVISRISYLISELKIPPNQILCITFTKAAADEMEKRFLSAQNAEDKEESSKEVLFGTVHSICYHILKESGRFKDYRLISESQKIQILKHILQSELKGKEIGNDFIFDVLSYISRRKNKLKAVFDERLNKEQCEQIFLRYGKMLSERKSIDFDDMVGNTFLLLKDNPMEREKWQKRFSYILVDEFQDLNKLQYEVICTLAQAHKNILVVGDDDQSIYGFRGAEPNLFQTFFEDYPDAGKLFLTENYRSGEKIVSLADNMIKDNQNRIDKKISAVKKGGMITVCFRDTRKEQESVLINHLRGLTKEQRNQSAVLLRTNREVVLYEALFRKNQIQTTGLKIKKEDVFQHFIMEDFCAYLRFLREGRKRKDFFKIMNKPEIYLEREALGEAIVSKQEILRFYQGNAEMQQRIERLFSAFDAAKDLSPYLAIKYFRQVIGYDKYLLHMGSRDEFNQNNEIANRLTEHFRLMKPKETVAEFTAGIEKSEKDRNIENAEGLKVMTMHGAKGLEFDRVFLPDLNEGILPAKNCKEKGQLEEERRLLYVAITRAKESLYLYYTAERKRKPCRFLKKVLTAHQ